MQAYFRLEKPVAFLVPHIIRLEYDINEEIGVPGTQVAILSMHQSGASNWTDVVFGFLSKPMNSPINPVSLSVMKSSLVDIFSQRSNLTLTKTTFGMPSSFGILKFPGGITIIPKLSPPVWMLPQVLFNFTLRNSLHEIEENFLQLKEQLQSGLQLMPYESVFVQVTNKRGSTQDPPVVVQVSVVSNLGNLELQRLKELAQEIKEYPTEKNLGLEYSVFGKVKGISLSSYLTHTLDAPAPTPTPSPAPSSDNRPNQLLPPLLNPPSPAMDPSCGGSPGPSPVSGPSPNNGPSQSSSPSPNLSPLPPSVSYGSRPHQENGYQKGLAPSPHSILPSSSSSEGGGLWRMICLLFFILTTTLHIL